MFHHQHKGGAHNSPDSIYMTLQCQLIHQSADRAGCKQRGQTHKPNLAFCKYLHTFTLPAGTWGSILIYWLIIVSTASSPCKKHNKSSQTSCRFVATPSPCFFNLQSLSYQHLKTFHYRQKPGYWPTAVQLLWQHASFPDMFTSSFWGWSLLFGYIQSTIATYCNRFLENFWMSMSQFKAKVSICATNISSLGDNQLHISPSCHSL